VDADHREGQAEDERDPADEVAIDASECEHQGHDDEPGEQHEPEDAGLGRDRDRRVVRSGRLRLLPR